MNKKITNPFSGQKFTPEEIKEINYEHCKHDADEAEMREVELEK